ncbi:MAG: HAD family hydrolase [Gemmataceae bacterium]|nr:HAD family hydrolase [Gemmataceae bacterium]
MQTLHTVLFDVDGTLLDTREFIFAAFEAVCRAERIGFPGRNVLAARMGEPLETIYARLGAADAARCCDRHRAFQLENLHLASPFPGVAESLGRLCHAGIALAAVTTRSCRTSLVTLEQAGIASLFGAVVSAEDAPALKPDPAPLRAALTRLGRPAVGAAMVGDTVADMLAGRALGLFTLGVTYGFHGEGVRSGSPDAVVHEVAAIPGALGVH